MENERGKIIAKEKNTNSHFLQEIIDIEKEMQKEKKLMMEFSEANSRRNRIFFLISLVGTVVVLLLFGIFLM